MSGLAASGAPSPGGWTASSIRSTSVLRGRERRRRRPAGHHPAPRPPRLAGHRRHLAQSDHAVAEHGLGLRRLGLLRDRCGPRHVGRSRRTRRGGSPAAHLHIVMDLVPNHSSDQHPWFQDPVAHGTLSTGTGMSGPTAHHLASGGAVPNNWRSDFLNGPAWSFDAVTGQWYPAPLRGRAARPQLVERGPARRVRPDPALLVRPRHRRLPHRRLPHDREGQAPAEPPPSTSGSTRRRALRQRAARARRAAALAASGRGVRPACCWARPRGRLGPAGALLRRGRRAQLAFNFPFLRAPFHAEPLLQFVADTEAALPEGVGGVDRPNHDHSRFPTAGHRTTLAGSASGSSCCSP